MTRLAPGRVLDLGCGAGRLELYLQAQGVEVTGIDNSPLAVEVCKQRGVQDARLLSVTQIGPQLGVFANVVMLGNNWGLMGSFKRARWLLRKLHRMTTPEGRIIAESNDVYATQNPIHLAYQAYNRERGRMSGQLRLCVHYTVHVSPWFDYLIVSKVEMEQIVQGTGWKVKEYINSEGSNYVVVLEKS
jgi:SAM-dependent methyltransferase